MRLVNRELILIYNKGLATMLTSVLVSIKQHLVTCEKGGRHSSPSTTEVILI